MTFHFEALELTALVERVVEDSKALAEQAQISITTQTLAPDAWINGDADRLMQAITNLLSNVIKGLSLGADDYRWKWQSQGPGLRDR